MLYVHERNQLFHMSFKMHPLFDLARNTMLSTYFIKLLMSVFINKHLRATFSTVIITLLFYIAMPVYFIVQNTSVFCQTYTTYRECYTIHTIYKINKNGALSYIKWHYISITISDISWEIHYSLLIVFI